MTTQRIRLFCTNGDYFPKSSNRDWQCLLRGTSWIIKQISNFAFEELKLSRLHLQTAQLKIPDYQKVKVKCALVQALRLCTGRTTHRGSRGIAILFHDHGTRIREGSASRTGRSLPPEKTRYPLYRRLGGPQGRSGQVRKISPPPGFDPRTVQPVASRYTDWANRPIDYQKITQ